MIKKITSWLLALTVLISTVFVNAQYVCAEDTGVKANQIIAYDEEQMTVTYQTSFDTVAGTISFENEALFLKDEEGYKLVWDDSMIFPNLTSTDKVRVSTLSAKRGEILDRNGAKLAQNGTLTPQQIEQLKNLGSKNLQAAQIFLGMLPITLVYPFLQKYFIK